MNELINESINDEAVYRKAPATLGLLISIIETSDIIVCILIYHVICSIVHGVVRVAKCHDCHEKLSCKIFRAG